MLPAGEPAKAARAKKAPKQEASAARPLLGATLEMVRVAPGQTPPRVPDDRAELASVQGHPINAPRMLGPGLGAALAYDGALHVLSEGQVRRYKSPGERYFEVAPGGKLAWVGTQQNVMHESNLESDEPVWRPIPIENAGRWGVGGLAYLDDDHLVFKTDKSLVLLARQADGWRPIHSVAAPASGVLHSLTPLRCIVFASHNVVRLLGLRGDKLQALAETKVEKAAYPPSLLPEVYLTEAGELWFKGDRYYQIKITPAP